MCFKFLSGVFLLLTFLSVMGELTKYQKQPHNETRRIRHHGGKTHGNGNHHRQYMAQTDDQKPNTEKERISEPTGEFLPEDDGNAIWDSSPSNPNLCPVSSCSADFQMSIAIRIKQIQDQFLKESGLDKAPNMTGVVISQNPQLRSEILHTNNQESVSPKRKVDSDDMAGDDPSYNIKNEKVFITASKERPDFIKLPEDDVVVYFNLSKEHISSIAFAYLHLWIRPTDRIEQEDRVAIASIYKISVKTTSDFPQLTEVYSDIKIPFKRGGDWFKVDVFSLARDWIYHPENNFGLTVVLTSADNKLLSFDSTSSDPAHAPLLELDVVEERNDRRKRYANNRICDDKKIQKVCCRYPLIVNFVDFQWDFIVAPKRYEANYCRGDCPFVFAQKYPHSTLLQTKFNNTNSTHGPCCGARVLDPLRMVYYDGAKIKVSTIKDMVVKQCACT